MSSQFPLLKADKFKTANVPRKMRPSEIYSSPRLTAPIRCACQPGSLLENQDKAAAWPHRPPNGWQEEAGSRAAAAGFFPPDRLLSSCPAAATTQRCSGSRSAGGGRWEGQQPECPALVWVGWQNGGSWLGCSGTRRSHPAPSSGIRQTVRDGLSHTAVPAHVLLRAGAPRDRRRTGCGPGAHGVSRGLPAPSLWCLWRGSMSASPSAPALPSGDVARRHFPFPEVPRRNG